MISTPMPKSKKKPQRTVFVKCSDHVGTSSNLWLDDNVQCSSCMKFESCQTLQPGALPRNCDVILFLMKKEPKTVAKKLNRLYECAFIDDFGVSDTTDEISVRCCKLDFGPT